MNNAVILSIALTAVCLFFVSSPAPVKAEGQLTNGTDQMIIYPGKFMTDVMGNRVGCNFGGWHAVLLLIFQFRFHTKKIMEKDMGNWFLIPHIQIEQIDFQTML